MGGPGSGRQATRLAVHECRCLDIGELCDGGRAQAQPKGEIHWHAELVGKGVARLRYAIRLRPDDGERVLVLSRYGARDQEIVLDMVAGRAICALCPFCGKAVRRLYVPPDQEAFRCRSCWGLVYRSAANPDVRWRLYARDVAGPTLSLLETLPRRVRHRPWRTYVEQPPAALAAELAGELPLGRQELRLWCLRLRAVGLSYRQIAHLTASSKSTVARLCAAGRAGIDPQELTKERLERDRPRPPLDDDLEALALHATALYGHVQRLGLHGYGVLRWETRTVVFADEAAKS